MSIFSLRFVIAFFIFLRFLRYSLRICLPSSHTFVYSSFLSVFFCCCIFFSLTYFPRFLELESVVDKSWFLFHKSSVRKYFCLAAAKIWRFHVCEDLSSWSLLLYSFLPIFFYRYWFILNISYILKINISNILLIQRRVTFTNLTLTLRRPYLAVPYLVGPNIFFLSFAFNSVDWFINVHILNTEYK